MAMVCREGILQLYISRASPYLLTYIFSLYSLTHSININKYAPAALLGYCTFLFTQKYSEALDAYNWSISSLYTIVIQVDPEAGQLARTNIQK
jgi:hypothetical protein